MIDATARTFFVGLGLFVIFCGGMFFWAVIFRCTPADVFTPCDVHAWPEYLFHGAIAFGGGVGCIYYALRDDA